MPGYSDDSSPEALSQMAVHYYIRFLLANPLVVEWDIPTAIYYLSHLFQKCQVSHVRGHQDWKAPVQMLSYSAQLNIRCDAKASRAHSIPDLPTLTMLSNATIFLLTSSGPITSRWSLSIRYYCAQHLYQKHCATKYNWDNDLWNSINWESFSNALKKFPHRKTHLVKFVNTCLPTNLTLTRTALYVSSVLKQFITCCNTLPS